MPYEIVLTIHIASFISNVSLVILADCIGLLWVIGKIRHLPRQFLLWAHHLIWIGLGFSIVTGVAMFLESAEYLLSTPVFYIKIFFLCVLLVNSVFISRHLHAALERGAFLQLTSAERRAFLISGAVSTLSWILVVVSAWMLEL